jgi:uncharacterized damage-inducible protein DinB
MRTMLCCLFTLSAITPAFAQSLSQGDRDRALSELHASRKQFLDSVADLTEAQWNFKPAPEVWSIAECAEHITLSEDLIMGVVRKALASPADPAKKEEVKGKDQKVLEAVVDRSQKFKAPEPLVPTHRWPTQQATIAEFKQRRDRNLEYVRTTPDDLRSHFAPHPVAGTLDAYQWILLLSAHSQRHSAQLNEVKQNPNFPK